MHEVREEVLLALLENPNLDPPDVIALLERFDLPASVLGAVAGRGGRRALFRGIP